MKLTYIALLITSLVSSVSAYPVTADTLNCRSGPGTSYNVVKSYKKGTNLKLKCQTNGPSVDGNTLWDKTQDGCYVSDRWVKTGSNKMVVGACGSGGGGGGSSTDTSTYEGKITRAQIINRALFWTNQHIPYSMYAEAKDLQGRKYRTDCSGFVSMSLHAYAPGYNTVSLPTIAKPINWADLKPGDLVGTLGPRINNYIGHVTLFRSWADAKKTTYNCLECHAGANGGCVASVKRVGWTDGPYTSKPWRYNKVID